MQETPQGKNILLDNIDMTKPLHPTLKACKCGYICTKRELYKHFDDIRRTMKAFGESPREFFAGHGEVPLNVDDSRLDLQSQLEQSLAEQQLIPSGHRLDDNNMEIPAR